MTIQDLKEYRTLKKECLYARKKVLKIEQDITSMRATVLSGMPKGNKIHDLSDLMVLLEKEKELYRELYNKKYNLLKEIEAVIEMIPRGELRQFLRLKYIEGKNYNEIRYTLYYCERMIYRIQKKALSEFEKYMNMAVNVI